MKKKGSSPFWLVNGQGRSMAWASVSAPGACLSALVFLAAATASRAALQPERAAFVSATMPRWGTRLSSAVMAPQLRAPLPASLVRGLKSRGANDVLHGRPGRAGGRRSGGAAGHRATIALAGTLAVV